MHPLAEPQNSGENDTTTFAAIVRQPCCQSTVLLVNQLDESHFGCVTAAGSELVDLGVTTVAICVLGSDLVEELLDNVFLGDISESSTAGS